jgi:hypothetical protein
VEDQMHINREAICVDSSWIFGKQEDLHEVCFTQSHWWASVTVTTYGDLSKRVKPYSLCRYWTDLSVCVHVPQRARWSENFRCNMRDRVKFVAWWARHSVAAMSWLLVEDWCSSGTTHRAVVRSQLLYPALDNPEGTVNRKLTKRPINSGR